MTEKSHRTGRTHHFLGCYVVSYVRLCRRRCVAEAGAEISFSRKHHRWLMTLNRFSNVHVDSCTVDSTKNVTT